MARISRTAALVFLVVTAPLALTGWALAAWWPTSFLVCAAAAIVFWTVATVTAADDEPSEVNLRLLDLRTS